MEIFMESNRVKVVNKNILKKKLKEIISADRSEIKRNRPYPITSKGIR